MVSVIKTTTGDGRLDRLSRPVGDRAPAIEAGTQRGHDFGHVPHEVVVNFGVIDYHHAAILGIQGAGHVLGPEPGEAVPVFGDDRGHPVVAECPRGTCAACH